jgi:hypothetical protein
MLIILRRSKTNTLHVINKIVKNAYPYTVIYKYEFFFYYFYYYYYYYFYYYYFYFYYTIKINKLIFFPTDEFHHQLKKFCSVLPYFFQTCH